MSAPHVLRWDPKHLRTDSFFVTRDVKGGVGLDILCRFGAAPTRWVTCDVTISRRRGDSSPPRWPVLSRVDETTWALSAWNGWPKDAAIPPGTSFLLTGCPEDLFAQAA